MNPSATVKYQANNGKVDSQIEQTKQQVDDLTNVMQQNIQKVLQRDAKLSILEHQSEALESQAGEFKQTSTRVRKWALCQNRKWTVILIVTIIVILAVIALIIGLAVGLNQNKK